jgi:hypothetical protein
MASKQALVSLFNTKFSEFLGDLIQVFPEDKEFRQFKSSMTLLITIDEVKLHYIFNKVIQPYRTNILSKNEDFFLKASYDELNDYQTSGVTGELINKLKTYWVELNDENHTIIWNYLTLLVKLSDRAASA